MKKIIALLMAITLLFSLSACKKQEEKTSDNNSDVTSNADFVKPDDYKAILTIKINPEFELYLDDKNDVVAINAVNDDAKSFKDEIDLKDKNFEKIIKELIETANEKGFIKANAEINLEATAKDASANLADILSKASVAAKDMVSELNLSVKVNIINDDIEKDNSSAETTSSKATESSKPTTQTTVSSKVETVKVESENKDSNQSKPAESKPAESKPAESKPTPTPTPTTPTVVNPKTNLDTNKEYISSIVRKWSDEEIYCGGIGFDSECAILLQANYVLEGTDPDISPEASYITYGGKKYYRQGAGQSPHYFEITDTEIIVKNSFWDETEKINAKMVLLSDGTLKVTYVSEDEKDRFTVGEILK